MQVHDFDLKPSRYAVRQQLDKQFGNPEYRQEQRMCNMPFTIAVVAGVAITAADVAVAAVVVGLVLTVVGKVTGNKTVSKIGMYVGLAGGVASLGLAVFSGISALAAGTSAATSAGGAAAGGAVTAADGTALMGTVAGTAEGAMVPVAQEMATSGASALGTVGSVAKAAVPIANSAVGVIEKAGVQDSGAVTSAYNSGSGPKNVQAFSDFGGRDGGAAFRKGGDFFSELGTPKNIIALGSGLVQGAAAFRPQNQVGSAVDLARLAAENSNKNIELAKYNLDSTRLNTGSSSPGLLLRDPLTTPITPAAVQIAGRLTRESYANMTPEQKALVTPEQLQAMVG